MSYYATVRTVLATKLAALLSTTPTPTIDALEARRFVLETAGALNDLNDRLVSAQEYATALRQGLATIIGTDDRAELQSMAQLMADIGTLEARKSLAAVLALLLEPKVPPPPTVPTDAEIAPVDLFTQRNKVH